MILKTLPNKMLERKFKPFFFFLVKKLSSSNITTLQRKLHQISSGKCLTNVSLLHSSYEKTIIIIQDTNKEEDYTRHFS